VLAPLTGVGTDFAALGVATLTFIDIAGEDGITYFLPFSMFVFLLALGENYNILVMSRVREEARALPLRTAVVHALERTGSTITSAGIILAGTFAVFAVAGGGSMRGQLRGIGFRLAVGPRRRTRAAGRAAASAGAARRPSERARAAPPAPPPVSPSRSWQHLVESGAPNSSAR
jgi:hypothetical protein